MEPKNCLRLISFQGTLKFRIRIDFKAFEYFLFFQSKRVYLKSNVNPSEVFGSKARFCLKFEALFESQKQIMVILFRSMKTINKCPT